MNKYLFSTSLTYATVFNKKMLFSFFSFIYNICSHMCLNLYINYHKQNGIEIKLHVLLSLSFQCWSYELLLSRLNMVIYEKICMCNFTGKWILIDAWVETHAQETPTGCLLSCHGYRQYFGCYGKPVSCRCFCVPI